MKKTKVLAMLTAVVLLIGMFCICAAAETKEATGCGQQLSLGDDLDMKFYVAADADTTVNVTVDGKTTAYDLRGKAPVAAGEGKGTYEIVVSLTAAQMTSQITLDFKQGGEDVQLSSSVREYAEAILGGEHPELTKTLVKHTLNYGAAAQKYFNVNTGSLANSGYELDYKAQLPEGYDTIGVEGQIGGVRIVGATLVFKSKITLRYIFEAYSLEGVNFTANGVSYTATEKDGQFFVDIPGINPNMYATNVVLQAVKGEETLAVTYSPMHYIVRMSKKVTTTEPMRVLLNAMYGYYEAASAYVADNSVEISLPMVSNGTISANKSVYRFGETVTLTATPANGYNLKSLTVKKDGQAIDIGAIKIAGGNYSFVAEDGAYTVEAEFAEPIFNVVKGEWDLNDQYNGSITIANQKEGTTVTTTGKNYAEVSVKVKDYTPSKNEDGSLKKGNFSMQIYFVFDNGKQYQVRLHNTDADGNYKLQNIGGGDSMVGWKWQADLTSAQKEKLLNGDGVDFTVKLVGASAELWVDGTKMKVFEELGEAYDGKVGGVTLCMNGNTGVKNLKIPYTLKEATPSVQISVAEMENGSVTPKFKNYRVGDTVTLTVAPDAGYSQKLYINGEPLLLDWKTNTYTFVATEESYSITGGFVPSLTTSANDANRWDTANQAHGIVNTYYPSNGNSGEFYIDYNYRAVTVKAKNYWANKDNKGEGVATVLGFKLSNGKTYNFRVILENGVYAYQRFGIAKPEGGNDWTKYELDAAAIAAFCGDGVDFKLERTAADTLTLSVNGVVYDTYKMAGVTASDTVTKVVISHYGHKGEKVAIPFLLQNPEGASDVQINIPALTNGTVTPTFDNYKIGDTVSLKVTPNQGYSQKLYVNGKPLMMDWKQNTVSFVATEEVCNITGSFEPSMEITPSDAGRFDTANQAHGVLNAYYPKNNDSWWVDMKGEYESLSVKTKNYLSAEDSIDGNGKVGYSVALRVTLDNGKIYAFRIYNKDGRYTYSRSGASGVAGWGGGKALDAAAIAAIDGEGVDFKVARTGANILTLSVNGVVMENYTMDGITAANKVVSVGFSHYGNKLFHVEVPFAVQLDSGRTATEINIGNMTNGTVTAERAAYEIGDTVTLTVTPNEDYCQKLYIDGQPLLLDYATGKYSFVATKATHEITGGFEPKQSWFWQADWNLINQGHNIAHAPAVEQRSGDLVPAKGGCNGVSVLFKDVSKGVQKELAIVLKIHFTDGKKAEVRLIDRDDNGKYCLQAMGDSFSSWDTFYWLSAEENEAVLNGDGVWYEMTREGTKLYLRINGNTVKQIDMSGKGITAETAIDQVKIQTYNFGYPIDVPYAFVKTAQ